MSHPSSHFDAAEALSRLMNKPQLLAKVLALFVEQVPTMLKQLDTAVAQQNYQQISMLVHTLKGNAGQVAALRLYEHFEVTERELKFAPEQLPVRLKESYWLFDKFVEAVRVQQPAACG